MKKLFNEIKIFGTGIGEHNISAHAAASAFYMFLSLVPFVALLSTVLPYTRLSQDMLFDIIYHYIPDALKALIGSVIEDIYLASDAILPLSIIFTIWLASRAFSSLIRGIEDIAGKHYASYLRRSLLACIYTIGIIIAMILLLLLFVFGKQMGEYTLFSPFIKLLLKLRFFVAAAILSLVFMMIYHWVPDMKLGFIALVPGSVAASVAWLLFTWLFSLFIRFGGGYSTYGNLATIVISLLWMYWCMYIILLGAYVNIYLYRRKHINKP